MWFFSIWVTADSMCRSLVSCCCFSPLFFFQFRIIEWHKVITNREREEHRTLSHTHTLSIHQIQMLFRDIPLSVDFSHSIIYLHFFFLVSLDICMHQHCVTIQMPTCGFLSLFLSVWFQNPLTFITALWKLIEFFFNPPNRFQINTHTHTHKKKNTTKAKRKKINNEENKNSGDK